MDQSSPAFPGLSQAEARARLLALGPNILPREETGSVWKTLRRLAGEPVLILLVVGAVIYFILGSAAEGTMLILFALFSVSLMILQERRSENALKALQDISAPLATVVREGAEQRIPSAEVVQGDVVLIGEGERVPADAEVLASNQLSVDESLLTGESVPVDKFPEPAGKAATEVRTNAIFSGTLAVRGHAIARVTATGANTETGKLGTSLATIESGPTHLQETTGRLVRIFGVLSLVVCGGLAIYYGLAAGDWLKGILSGIALGMAMLPEEFPVALAVFLAIGSWRLAQIGVLVRQAAVVEALGAATCLCVDKTGTITENRMRLRVLDDGKKRLSIDAKGQKLSGRFDSLLRAAFLASRRAGHDPMDLAVLDAAELALAVAVPQNWSPAREYGLTPKLLALSRAWRDGKGRMLVATKGAPEAVAALCRLGTAETAIMLERVQALADEGLRVLGVAEAVLEEGAALPADPRGLGFRFLGLAGFEDPVRATVPAAIAEAGAAGITVKMITGDFPATARAIAAAAGISSDRIVTGAQLAAADPAEIATMARKANIFARVRPEQKLLIVSALQAAGETVAMTGDGVNDAPALKVADIGIAMGQRGTDVAREASDLILLDEDFGRITDAVRMGRRIFDNLRKVILYITAVHVPIAGMAFLPVVMGLPVVLWPLHVVVLEMVIDSMCSLAFEATPAERDVMNRPPRPRSEPVVGAGQIAYGLIQGTMVLAAIFALYWMSLGTGAATDTVRTMVLLAMIVGNLGLVLANASLRSAFSGGSLQPQPWFWAIAATALGLMALILAVPFLRQLFQLDLPSIPQLFAAILTGLAAIALIELLKLAKLVQRVEGAQAR